MKIPSTEPARGGQLAFAIVFVLFSSFLLVMLNSETRFTPGKQLFAQPRFWPGAAVIGMVLFGLGHMFARFQHRRHDNISEVFWWLRSIEYLCWFMAYVYAVPVLGYLLATILFMMLLTYRLGYRSKKMLLFAMLVGFVVVLVFKAGLSVSIPGGALYEFLPGSLRSFMLTHF